VHQEEKRKKTQHGGTRGHQRNGRAGLGKKRGSLSLAVRAKVEISEVWEKILEGNDTSQQQKGEKKRDRVRSEGVQHTAPMK